MPQFRYRDFYCFRRFKDFDYLYTKLSAAHAGVIVPPLPDKGVIGTPIGVSHRRGWWSHAIELPVFWGGGRSLWPRV